jgi:hypothetical protein
MGCAAQVDISGVEGQRHVGPLRLHDWAGDGDVVDALVVVPLLSLRVEVDAGPPSDHVDDSAIRLISEVFLFWRLGVVDVWLMRVWGWEWRWYDLYLLVVLVCVVRWMMGGIMVVWLWEVVLICVRDNSWVVSWLRPRHPVPGGLRFWAVSRWVRAVFTVKQAVKFARLLRPSSAPTTSAIALALGGIILMARGVVGGVLVGNVMHLLLTAAVPTGV